MEISQERNEPIPGLLYEANVRVPAPHERTDNFASNTVPDSRTLNELSCGNAVESQPNQANLVLVENGVNEGEDEDLNTSEESSVKLGLGDFVFYSVLVARACLFDVSSMIAAFVSILMVSGSY